MWPYFWPTRKGRHHVEPSGLRGKACYFQLLIMFALHLHCSDSHFSPRTSIVDRISASHTSTPNSPYHTAPVLDNTPYGHYILFSLPLKSLRTYPVRPHRFLTTPTPSVLVPSQNSFRQSPIKSTSRCNPLVVLSHPSCKQIHQHAYHFLSVLARVLRPPSTHLGALHILTAYALLSL